MKVLYKIQDPNCNFPSEVDVIKADDGVRLIRENVEYRSYRKPKYHYGIQYRESGHWGFIEWRIGYADAKESFDWESQFIEL